MRRRQNETAMHVRCCIKGLLHDPLGEHANCLFKFWALDNELMAQLQPAQRESEYED